MWLFSLWHLSDSTAHCFLNILCFFSSPNCLFLFSLLFFGRADMSVTLMCHSDRLLLYRYMLQWTLLITSLSFRIATIMIQQFFQRTWTIKLFRLILGFRCLTCHSAYEKSMIDSPSDAHNMTTSGLPTSELVVKVFPFSAGFWWLCSFLL